MSVRQRLRPFVDQTAHSVGGLGESAEDWRRAATESQPLVRIAEDGRVSDEALAQCLESLANGWLNLRSPAPEKHQTVFRPRAVGAAAVQLDFCLRSVPREEREAWIAELIGDFYSFPCTGAALRKSAMIASRRRSRRISARSTASGW